MNGGNIKENTSGTTDGGGGVAVFSNSSFTMNGGSITGNTATTKYGGGGVWVNGGTFNMSGGSITGNTSNNQGGGVYVMDGTFNVSGTPVISGNTKSGAANNVYLASGKKINITSDKLSPAARIGVYPADGAAPGTVFTSGWTSSGSSTLSGIYAVFTADGVSSEAGTLGQRLNWPVVDNDELKFQTGAPVHQHDGNGTAWTSTTTLPTTAGSYFLTADVTLNGTWSAPSGETNLCLNGYVIQMTGSGSVISIPSGATLNLYDCSETPHTFKENSDGLWVLNGVSGKEHTVTGGCITGGNTTGSAGGVLVDGGTFTMSGGNIVGNYTSNNGGGVYVPAGTFTMSGGNIVGNSAGSGGGVRSGGTFTMSGGNIVGNKSVGSTGAGGGGVYSEGSFEMFGTASISGNTANNAGGGVRVEMGSFTMSGSASITKNTTTTSGGGGVFVNDSASTFTMSDSASITQNTAQKGGGVYTKKKFEMSGDASISENKATGSVEKNGGGGVYVEMGEFTMSGGSISKNEATGSGENNGGGGVYVETKGTFNMSGGSISENKATGSGENNGGGGVFLQWQYAKFTMSGTASITGNTATKKGGGVYLNSNDGFTMNSGTISENTAELGGGVYLYATNKRFDMTGGKIMNNTATENGGGVYVNNKSSGDVGLRVSGTPIISGNKKGTGEGATDNNVYLMGDNKIPITAALTTDAKIWVNPAAGAAPGKAFTSGWKSKAGVSDPSTVFFADGENYVAISSGDEVTFAANYEVFDSTGQSLGKALSLSAAYQKVPDGGGTIKVLQQIVTETAQTDMGGTKSVTLDLNGNTIKAGDAFSDSNLISWGSSGKLTIDGIGTPGSLSGADKARVLSITAGEVELKKGIITGGNKGQGGGVFISSGTFTMTGGKIENNTAENQGGGVFISNGTFTMSGGEISGNTVDSSSAEGGGVYVMNGTFNVSGTPVISGNKYIDGSPTNVSLANGKLQIIGELETPANICIKSPDATGDIFAQAGTPTGGTEYTITAADAGYFHTDRVPDQKAAVMTSSDSPKTSLLWVSTTITLKGSGTIGDQTTAAVGTKRTLYPSSGITPLGEKAGYTFKGWGPEDAPTAALIVFNSADNSISLPTEVEPSFADYLTQQGKDVVWSYTGTELTLNPVFTLNAPEITIDGTSYSSGSEVTKPYKGQSGYKLTAFSNVESGYTVDWAVPANLQINTISKDITIKDVSQSGKYTAQLINGSGKVEKTAEITITITPVELQLNWTNDSLTYNGSEQAPTVAISSGQISGDDVAVSVTADSKKKDANTCTATYTATAELTGAQKGNYTIKSGHESHSFTIAKKPVTITWPAEQAKLSLPYNGAEQTFEGAAIGAVETADLGKVAFVYKEDATTTPKTCIKATDAGTYSAEITGLSGDRSANYELPSEGKTKEWKITSVSLTVTAKPKTITYGDAAANDGVEYSGFVGGETESVLSGTLTYAYKAEDTSDYAPGSPVGNYNITPSGLTSNNYNITFVNGTLTVQQKPLKIASAAGITKVYDSTANLTGTELGAAGVTYTFDGTAGPIAADTDYVAVDASAAAAQFSQAGVGTALSISNAAGFKLKAGASGDKSGNYTLSEQPTGLTGNITARDISSGTVITLVNDNLTYTGSDQTVQIQKVEHTISGTSTKLTLTKDTDYTITSGDKGTAIGNYTLTISGTGNFTGTATKEWHIVAGQTAVTLDPQGGTGGTASVTASYGQPMPSATMPTQSGYTFGGYYDSQSGGTQYYKADGTSAKNWDKTVTAATLYAHWTRNAATVTFNVQGHGTAPASQTIDIGGKVTRPADPSEEYYTFGGWYKEPACTNEWNFETDTVQGDITLYAKWTVAYYLAKMEGYTYAGGIIPEPYLLPEELSDAMYFYSATADGPVTPWTDITTTTLDAGTWYIGAESPGHPEAVIHRSTFTVGKALQPAPEFSATERGGEIIITVHGYDPAETYMYSIKEAGTGNGEIWILLPGGSAAAAGLKTDTDYEIKVKINARGNYEESISAPKTVRTGSTFSVTYSANGGVGSIEPQTGTAGESITVKSSDGITREGYDFDEWNTQADGSGISYYPGDTVSEGVVLYAQWAGLPYTITFDGNGGTVSQKTQTLYYGSPAFPLEAAASRSGYVHSGWAVSSTGSAVYAPAQDVQNLGDITLYAVWTPAEKLHTLTVNVENADGTPALGASVQLRQGNAVIMNGVSITGSVTFPGIPEGIYTLEAASADKTKTSTKSVTITGDHEETIVFSAEDVSAKVEISTKNATPAVAVGGVDTAAEGAAEYGKSVTVTVKVEAKVEGAASPEEQQTQIEIEKIKEGADAGSELQYLGITVEKTVNDGEPEFLTSTAKVLEFIIPYDFTGKDQIKVYRCHDGTAEPLTPLQKKPEPGEETDGTYWLDLQNGLIYIYADKFSTYSVGYVPVSPKPSHRSSTQGVSVWATPEPTEIPTVTPTPTPTPDVPTVKPTETQTPAKSPVPFAGLLAGLGAAAAVAGLRMRRK